MSTLRFLLLEDKLLDTEVIQAKLTDGGIDYELLRVDTRADFVTALETQVFDLILAAYAMPGFDGMAALEIASNLSPDVPFIFVSASLGEELAIETLKRGATDYVLKQRLERLVTCVQRALREAQERRERQAALRERKKIEQERERFLLVSSDLQVITGSNGYFQWVSPTFERVLGWTPSEMIARPWSEFVHPDDISASVSETERLFSGSETFAFENRYRHKDGSYRWLRWRAQPYPEEQVIYGAAVDITAAKRDEAIRKQAVAELRESEARLRFMLDASQIGEWDLDLTTQPHTAHRSLRHDQIFGYESLLPEWSYEIFLTHVHPDDRAAVNEKFQQTLSASTSWDFECRIIHSDQSLHWIEARSSVYCDQNGTPTRLLGMVVDITERKQVETALRESEEKYRTLFDSIDEGFCIIEMMFDDDENPIDYRFLIANPAFEKQTGSKNVVGRTVREIAPQHQ